MPVINNNQKGYLTDLAVISVGGLTGMAVDTAISNGWNAANLPIIGLGTFHLDDAILLIAEGFLGYWLYKRDKTGKKLAAKFVIGMFAMTVAMELGEIIISALNPITRAVAMNNQRLAVINPQVTRYVVA